MKIIDIERILKNKQVLNMDKEVERLTNKGIFTEDMIKIKLDDYTDIILSKEDIFGVENEYNKKDSLTLTRDEATDLERIMDTLNYIDEQEVVCIVNKLNSEIKKVLPEDSNLYTLTYIPPISEILNIEDKIDRNAQKDMRSCLLYKFIITNMHYLEKLGHIQVDIKDWLNSKNLISYLNADKEDFLKILNAKVIERYLNMNASSITALGIDYRNSLEGLFEKIQYILLLIKKNSENNDLSKEIENVYKVFDNFHRDFQIRKDRNYSIGTSFKTFINMLYLNNIMVKFNIQDLKTFNSYYKNINKETKEKVKLIYEEFEIVKGIFPKSLTILPNTDVAPEILEDYLMRNWTKLDKGSWWYEDINLK